MQVCWFLSLVMATTTTLPPYTQANIHHIAVVHDNWYTDGGALYHDLMVKLVLEEVTAVHPSVRFYTIPVHHHPAARLSTLLSNTSWPWSGLVSLGGCRAQRVVARDVGLLEMPFLLVAWNTCYGLHLPSYNTVILNDVKFDNRFNCLTWVVSVWIKNSFLATITPFNHFNVTHGGPQSFIAQDLMFQCAGNQEVGNLYRSRRNIKGKTISVVTIHRPPFVFLKTDSAGNIISQSGFAFEMLSQLQSKLGFKYKVALPYDGNWGTKLPNGTWNGMVGMVYRREADLGVAPFTITLERAQAIEFTFPFYVEPSSILTPVTRQTRKITAFLDPFHYKVWVVILITMVMLGPVMYLMARIQWLTFFYPHDNTHVATSPITLSGHYWLLYASFVRQGVDYPMNSPSRVVFGTWITAVIALSCAYTGVLISFLTVPKTERAISSLYDLPKQKNYQWTFMKGSAHESLFLGDGAEQIYKTIGAPFLEDMSDLVTTNQKAIDQVLQGTHVYIKERSFLDFVLEEDFRKTGKCNLDIAPTEFFPAGFGWIHQKDDTIGQLLNREFIRMQQTGLLRKWKLKYWPKPNVCTSGGKKSKTKALGFLDMLGSFAVLGCGFMCGLVILCSEYFYKRRGVEAGDRNRVNKIDKQHILKEDISKPRTDKQSRLRSSHTLISAQSSSSLQSLTDDDRHVPTLNLIPATPDHQLRH